MQRRATKALITALGRDNEGPWTVALVNALGDREDGAAVESLVPLLKDKDADVAIATASALGRIGGPVAAKELASARTRGPAAFRAVATDAYLSCADRFLARDQFTEAAETYKKLYGSGGSADTNLLKIAAMQGMAAIKAAKEAGRKTRRVASQPSSRMSPAAPAASAEQKTVDPTLVAA
jgi:HEAT repeat protein